MEGLSDIAVCPRGRGQDGRRVVPGPAAQATGMGVGCFKGQESYLNSRSLHCLIYKEGI